MSTMLTDKGDHVLVSTVSAPGKRKRLPRRSVMVRKADADAVRAEIVRQATLLREEMGVEQKPGRPVV